MDNQLKFCYCCLRTGFTGVMEKEDDGGLFSESFEIWMARLVALEKLLDGAVNLMKQLR